jgi:hypothetical protein
LVEDFYVFVFCYDEAHFAALIFKKLFYLGAQNFRGLIQDFLKPRARYFPATLIYKRKLKTPRKTTIYKAAGKF